jgi:hypothetical protein
MSKNLPSNDIRRFESSYAVLDFLENTPSNPLMPSKRAMAEPNEGGYTLERVMELYGSANMKDACHLGKFGWKEGAKKITEKMNLTKPLAKGLDWENDVSGAFPNVARYITGVPDCMRRKKMIEQSRKPMVEITVQVMVNGSTGFDGVLNLGAAIIEAIDSLENQGFICSLDFMGMTICSEDMRLPRFVGWTFPLKQAGEGMDIDKLIFWLAHLSVVRRFDFRFFETIWANSYGSYGGVPSTESVKQFLPPDMILFNTKQASCNPSMTEARKIVREQFSSFRPDICELLSEIAA